MEKEDWKVNVQGQQQVRPFINCSPTTQHNQWPGLSRHLWRQRNKWQWCQGNALKGKSRTKKFSSNFFFLTCPWLPCALAANTSRSSLYRHCFLVVWILSMFFWVFFFSIFVSIPYPCVAWASVVSPELTQGNIASSPPEPTFVTGNESFHYGILHLII